MDPSFTKLSVYMSKALGRVRVRVWVRVRVRVRVRVAHQPHKIAYIFATQFIAVSKSDNSTRFGPCISHLQWCVTSFNVMAEFMVRPLFVFLHLTPPVLRPNVLRRTVRVETP
jgi:hypothetical protein